MSIGSEDLKLRLELSILVDRDGDVTWEYKATTPAMEAGEESSESSEEGLTDEDTENPRSERSYTPGRIKISLGVMNTSRPSDQWKVRMLYITFA
jgi:hypothetical protein